MPLRYGLVFTPMHRQTDARRVEPFGSATLVTFGAYHVLISAAHVLAQARTLPVLLPGRPAFSRLVGPAIISDLAARQAGVVDPYDLGFVFVDDAQKASLEAVSIRFLPHTEIATAEDLDRASVCVFCGYPVSQSDTRVGASMIHSTPFYARCAILKSEDPSGRYIIGKYDRENVTSDASGQRVTGPEAWGSSGGPIWVSTAEQTPKLAGIGTDYDPDKRRLKGTRLSTVLPEILRHAPKTG